MELNKNSFSAKLYRWFYDQNVMPNNLCPYFWKLIFMWILIIPYVLITLPSQIMNKFKRITFSDAIGETFAAYIVLFALLILLSFPISLFITFADDGFWDNMRNGSIVFWCFLTLVALYYGIKTFVIWINIKRGLYDDKGYRYYGYDSQGKKIYHKPKNPNIVAEFIKSKYKKYCPKIDWKDERNKN